MPWRPISQTDLEVSPDEQAIVNTITGAANKLPAILSNVVAEVQARCLAGSNQVDQPGTVPDQLRNYVLDIVRWRWFSELPSTGLLSDSRQKAYTAAMAVLDRVSKPHGEDRLPIEIPANPQNVVGPSNRAQVIRPGRHVRTDSFDGMGQT